MALLLWWVVGVVVDVGVVVVVGVRYMTVGRVRVVPLATVRGAKKECTGAGWGWFNDDTVDDGCGAFLLVLAVAVAVAVVVVRVTISLADGSGDTSRDTTYVAFERGPCVDDTEAAIAEEEDWKTGAWGVEVDVVVVEDAHDTASGLVVLPRRSDGTALVVFLVVEVVVVVVAAAVVGVASSLCCCCCCRQVSS